MGFNFFKKRGKTEVVIPASPLKTAEEAVPQAQKVKQADPALIAVITAAVAAMLADEATPGGFIVRRVKRISNAPAWQRAGREEQTYSRL